MKIYVASDHTGYTLKETIKQFLQEKNFVVEDCGAYAYDADDDYPDFIAKAARAVGNDPSNARAIVIGGSGQGEAIVANKIKGVRCALFYSPAIPVQAINIEGLKSDDPYEIIKLTREHNDANVLSIAARFVRTEDVLNVVLLWLDSPGPTSERHLRRIEKIKTLENS